MKLILVAGARPNFMKIAPLIKAIKFFQSKGQTIDFKLVHTGQHYDYTMSKSFFDQLDIPEPDANLNVGSGSQAVQTAKIMISFEEYLQHTECDCVVVVGDVTSTMACTLVAKKMNLKVAHVEAGLRSYDMAMPEEINRIVTDSLADYLFTTTKIASENLLRMGVSGSKIFFVGNTMIDNLIQSRDMFRPPVIWEREGLQKKSYFLMTLHRPSNVDDTEKLSQILSFIDNSAENLKVIFPVHPRTASKLLGINLPLNSILLEQPFSYFEFMYLVENALCVITDSGGIQEETTFMGVPCITLRENTERPETVEIGTNELTGLNYKEIDRLLSEVILGKWKSSSVPDLWDGKAALKIIDTLNQL